MAVTDPISDLLTRIRNAQLAHHETLQVPYSKMKESIVRILTDQGYLGGYKINEQEPYNLIVIRLKYVGEREPAIRRLQRVSKPGRRVYVTRDQIPRVLGGLGVNILSTSRGVLSGGEARQQGVGGELLCQIY